MKPSSSSKNQAGFIVANVMIGLMLAAAIVSTVSLLSKQIFKYKETSDVLSDHSLLTQTSYIVGNTLNDEDGDALFEIDLKNPIKQAFELPEELNVAGMFVVEKGDRSGQFLMNSRGYPIMVCGYDYRSPHPNEALLPVREADGEEAFTEVAEYPVFMVISDQAGQYETSCGALFNLFVKANKEIGKFRTTLKAQNSSYIVDVYTHEMALSQFSPSVRALSNIPPACLGKDMILKWNADGSAVCQREIDPNANSVARNQLPICGLTQMLILAPAPDKEIIQACGDTGCQNEVVYYDENLKLACATIPELPNIEYDILGTEVIDARWSNQNQYTNKKYFTAPDGNKSVMWVTEYFNVPADTRFILADIKIGDRFRHNNINLPRMQDLPLELYFSGTNELRQNIEIHVGLYDKLSLQAGEIEHQDIRFTAVIPKPNLSGLKARLELSVPTDDGESTPAIFEAYKTVTLTFMK